MGGPDPGRKDRTTFRKRAQTLLSKSHELASVSGAKVYLVIDHPRAQIVYNSQDEQWPPRDEELERKYSNLQRLTHNTMQQHLNARADQRELLQLTQYFAYRAQLLRNVAPGDREDQTKPSADNSTSSS
ncbi:hypothetical protein BDV59DRAFT_206275 [Aspergillus ambiguus]|uniref:uncharacterized protein n=1 Tax=Aspergillus ambiguus TaxID=176160 RepID=UPI003CCCD841